MSGLDWMIVAVYLGGVVALGLWAGRKDDDMEEYFLGGHNIPWWAALLSMVATEVSAATFLGAPEQGYTRDLTYLQFAIGSILARIVLAVLFIGIFYRLRVYTVYGFLRTRFGYPTKTSAASAFLLGRLFAGGSRLFIASLAVQVVTGFDLAVSILILGCLAILYTIFGGIKAVIWTDVVQAIVLAMGAFLSIYFLYRDIPLTWSEMFSFWEEHQKLKLFGTGEGYQGRALFENAYHFIPAIVGGFFLTMATHGTDQSMIQRLLTCRTSSAGKLSMVLSGFLGIGIAILFMFVGLMLFAYVETSSSDPALLQIAADLKASGQNGYFYLHYIVLSLPPGMTGLIIAAVIAAAMSSIDSELNAMSSAVVNDFYLDRYEADDATCLKVAKLATLGCGAALIGLAVLIADFYLNNPHTDLLSIALGVMTLFYGGLLGIFLVGLLTRKRGNNFTCVAGLSFSLLLITCIAYKQRILPALGLYDPEQGGFAWARAFYEFQLAWPWFVVIGCGTAVFLALLGRTNAATLRIHSRALAGLE